MVLRTKALEIWKSARPYFASLRYRKTKVSYYSKQNQPQEKTEFFHLEDTLMEHFLEGIAIH